MFGMFGIGPLELLVVVALVGLPMIAGVGVLIATLVSRSSQSQVQNELTLLQAENQRLRDELARLKSSQ